MNFYELLYNGDVNYLIEKALPVLETDKDAERAFLRLFIDGDNMWLLKDDAIDMLEEEGKKGNKYAQYGYARWQSIVRGGEQSVWLSYCSAQDAMDNGLPDAYAMMAQTYIYGDVDHVNWERADELMEIAIQKGSELGLRYRLQQLCYGKHFEDPQPEKAVELADELIAKDEAAGIEPCGWWYYYRACAKEDRIGRTRVVDDYKRALELGVLRAYEDLALAAGYGDDNDVLIESEEYTQYILKGIAHRCAGSYYLDAVRLMKRYQTLWDLYTEQGTRTEGLSYDTLNKTHEALFSQLSEAARLGYNGAWYVLGGLYFDGDYGFDQDTKSAFTCYSNGTIHDHMGCTERLWKLMHDHEIDRPLEYMDSIALQGARQGSKRLLAETVIAHQEGRLEKFHEEISKYYEPIFDAPEFSLDDDWNADPADYDDDYEEDDGRYDAWV